MSALDLILVWAIFFFLLARLLTEDTILARVDPSRGNHSPPRRTAAAHDGTRAASCFVVDAHSATLLYSEDGEMQKQYKFARARRCDERLRLLDDVATAETRMKTVHHPPC